MKKKLLIFGAAAFAALFLFSGFSLKLGSEAGFEALFLPFFGKEARFYE